MSYKEMYQIYKSTGLNNYIFNCLGSTNKDMQQYAINTLNNAHLKNKDDVLLYIAMNI